MNNNSRSKDHTPPRVTRMKLTDANVRSMKPPTGKTAKIVYDTLQPNFAVRNNPVSPRTGKHTKSWIVRVVIDGKRTYETIGNSEILLIRSVDENGKENGARHQARIRLLQISEGIGTQDIKNKKLAQRMTFGEVKAEYVANKRTKNGALRSNSIRDIESCLSEWNDVPVAKIDRKMCLSKFYEISARTPTQANRDFRNLRALLNRARERTATEDGEYLILATNPVTQLFKKNGLAQWNPSGVRNTRIPKDKIGVVFNLLELLADQNNNNQTTYTSADLILFLLFTGCRIGEARTLQWNNIDLQSKIKTFSLSESVVKNHNGITLPISGALATVFERRLAVRNKSTDYVFPAIVGKAGFVSDPRALFKKITVAAGANVHPHAVRRTFDDIAQIVGVDSDQRRQLLNHKANDVHSAHYSNNPDPDILLPAVDKVGAWVVEQGKIAVGDNVIDLGAYSSTGVSKW